MPDESAKIIRKVAKERLAEKGFKQKGRSRLWYFSGDYYLILVEFQPSSWEKGTYLNVGLDFHWYPKEYFSFEFGQRLADFKRFEDENQFRKDIEEMCDVASVKYNQYRQVFKENAGAADRLLKLYDNTLTDWDKFSIGVLFGVGGQSNDAIKYLKQISGEHYTLDFEIARAKTARAYIQAIEEDSLASLLGKIIEQTKQLKGIN
jgi:hypothetical protein